MNRNLLEYKLKQKGYWYNDISNWLGVTNQSVRLRLSGKIEFKRSEIKCLITKLNLTNEEIIEIFFYDNKVN